MTKKKLPPYPPQELLIASQEPKQAGQDFLHKNGKKEKPQGKKQRKKDKELQKGQKMRYAHHLS